MAFTCTGFDLEAAPVQYVDQNFDLLLPGHAWRQLYKRGLWIGFAWFRGHHITPL